MVGVWLEGDTEGGGCEGAWRRLRDGTRGGRTVNMNCMVVTLDVSKLSGWLNADAPCRESKGGHTVQGEVPSRI